MTSRQQRVLTLGAMIAVISASFGWQAARRVAMPSPAVVPQTEDQRLHDLALRDLKDTQDEVAKMKAYGIEMHPRSEK